MSSDLIYFVNNPVTLEDWIHLVLKKDSNIFPNNCFPTNELLEKYIETVQERSDYEVKALISKFLIPTGSYEFVKLKLKMITVLEKQNDNKSVEMLKSLKETEYYRRLTSGEPPFEGLTWVLDLLPNSPKTAIEGIKAYLLANISFLPDYSIDGLYDTMAIIRAKFINREYSRDVYLSLEPIEFEWLVQELYKEMGYQTSLTKISRDMGVDVIAERHSIGEKEKLIIQCKRVNKNVGQPVVRDLYGTISKLNATKGVIVSSSDYTKPAREFIEDLHYIELIGHKELTNLLNRYLGPYWPFKLDKIFVKGESST